MILDSLSVYIFFFLTVIFFYEYTRLSKVSNLDLYFKNWGEDKLKQLQIIILFISSEG